jgi:phage-related protein
MITFLVQKGGVVAFTFTPPGESEIKVICKQWDKTTIVKSNADVDSFASLSVAFERVYE